MKLQQFNGGLNTRQAPHQIQPNEAIEFENIDNTQGTLKSVYDKAEDGLTMDQYAHYFAANSEWVHSATHRDYLEYQENLYYTEPSAVPKYYDGTSHLLLGILKPAGTITVAVGAAGLLTGTYNYVVTYYNSAKGIESQPCTVSADVVVASEQVDISAIPVSSDTQVDQKRIYRVGGALTSFSLVATITNATTVYTDNIADASIPGDDMVATDNKQALSGLKYLTEAYGILFGVFGDKLYYSKTGAFTYWPSTYFVDLPHEITGIAATSIGILIFSEYKTQILTGTSREVFSLRPFSADQGCLSFDSIQYVKGAVMWVSSDGICTVNGSLVQVVSKGRLGKADLTVVNSTFHDETYYALLSTGKIIAYDFRFGPIMKYLSLGVTRLAIAEDILYGYNGTAYFKLFTGVNLLPFAYTSPELPDGSLTQRKIYKSVLINSTGTLTVEVYVDGKSVSSAIIRDNDVNEIKIPEAEKNGYRIQFRITGSGEVLELDYTVKGVSK